MNWERILVCGSRTWPTADPIVEQVLTGIAEEAGKPLTIIEGGARGADRAGVDFAERYDHHHVPFPADWDKYGKRAGYVRNAQMLDEGKPDVVLAFVDKPLAESKGTAMMVNLAVKAGVSTYVTQRVVR